MHFRLVASFTRLGALLCCMSTKSGSKFKEFKVLVENATCEKLCTLRSDNGGEYFSNDFNEYCKQMGILHQSSNPYTPQQNGKAERLNKTIINSTRALLIHSKLPLSFWAEAINCATYIYNRSPHAAIEGKTPYE